MASVYKNNLQLLYESHLREISAFVRRRIGGEEAADVVQDTYLRVLQYAGQEELENPRAYLYRVASNVSADRGAALKLNAERTDNSIEPDTLHATACGPEEVADSRQRLQLCLAALNDLPEVYRHVFLLHRIDGLGQGEIAEVLGIPKRTVERYIAKTLAHCLERLGSEI